MTNYMTSWVFINGKKSLCISPSCCWRNMLLSHQVNGNMSNADVSSMMNFYLGSDIFIIVMHYVMSIFSHFTFNIKFDIVTLYAQCYIFQILQTLALYIQCEVLWKVWILTLYVRKKNCRNDDQLSSTAARPSRTLWPSKRTKQSCTSTE